MKEKDAIRIARGKRNELWEYKVPGTPEPFENLEDVVLDLVSERARSAAYKDALETVARALLERGK